MEGIKKIQLSPTRIIPDVTTVWNHPGDEVDIVMDLGGLTFREGSIEQIYSIHVVEHMFSEEATKAIANWSKCLKSGGDLFVLTNDFAYVNRAFLGGDILIEEINQHFTHPSQYTQDYLIKMMDIAGFQADKLAIWYDTIPLGYQRQDYELVIGGKKHG